MACAMVFAQSPINFDGILSEGEWENAQRFSINYEIQPGNNSPSPNKTEVYVLYSPTHIFVGFDAKANMATLRSAIRNRDEAFRDDIVMFGVDTFGDGRYGISVGANAEGSQVDTKFSATDDDDSCDVNFESKASKGTDGYQVELIIPFSAYQFNMAEEMKWNLILYRSTYTNGVRSQNINFPIDRNNSCFLCQSPDQLVLKNIKPDQRLFFLPYVFSGYSSPEETSSSVYGKPSFNVGLGGLIDLSNNTSLEYTINPDFSQVEADVSQINANTTFALYYPERRPFFNEGKDIVSTQMETVYTRAINQPIFSTKLIHQDAKQRIYWLAAYDSKTAYMIGNENESYFGEGEENFSNIFRYQRTYKGGSNFGMISTNRFLKGGGSDNLFGLTATYRAKEKYSFSLEAYKNFTEEPETNWIEEDTSIANKTVVLDGETLQGDAFNFWVERNTQNWNSSLYYNHKSPNYRTPLGFTVQTSVRELGFEHGYTHFYKDKFVKQLVIELEGDMQFNYSRLRKQAGIYLGTYIEMTGNLRTNFSVGHLLNSEYKGFNPKGLNSLSWWVGYTPSEMLRLNVFAEWEKAINFDELILGKSFFFGTFNNIQLSDKFRLSPSLRYSEMNRLDGNEKFYKGYIARLNVNYQFNQNLSFRLVGEFNEFDGKYLIQPLLKWNPNPFTIFYVGGNNNYQFNDQFDSYRLEDAQLYMKFQYQIGN